MAAAADCRAPYFDWAAAPSQGSSILPASVGESPTINISGPAGTQTIANPLFTYDFKPPDPSVFFNITPVYVPTTRRLTTVDAYNICSGQIGTVRGGLPRARVQKRHPTTPQ